MTNSNLCVFEREYFILDITSRILVKFILGIFRYYWED